MLTSNTKIIYGAAAGLRSLVGQHEIFELVEIAE